jgi:hypothetical protein
MTYFDELKLKILARLETVTPQMLENTWKETEYYFVIIHD